MSTHVIIPWHDNNDTHRSNVLDWLQHRWREDHPEFNIVLGALSEDSDWCKADAVEVGIHAAEAEPDDLLIIADADVWVPYTAIDAAVEAVELDNAAWSMPHRAVHRLTEQGTREALTLTQPDWEQLCTRYGYDRPPYLGTVGGGITILRLSTYRDCPLDPRFVGWGQEDESWGDALRTLHGHRHRGSDDLYHLWHPPLPRMAPGIGSLPGKHLRDRYRRSVGNPTAMRSLVDAGRDHLIEL